MKDEQLKLLYLLLRAWESYPALRLCQLIENACGHRKNNAIRHDLFYITDEELSIDLKHFTKVWLTRTSFEDETDE